MANTDKLHNNLQETGNTKRKTVFFKNSFMKFKGHSNFSCAHWSYSRNIQQEIHRSVYAS